MKKLLNRISNLETQVSGLKLSLTKSIETNKGLQLEFLKFLPLLLALKEKTGITDEDLKKYSDEILKGAGIHESN